MDMKVTEVPTISNLNFEERCFSICIPFINDVWNSQYSTIKLNLTLKFWKSLIWRKNLDFFLFWRRTGMIIRLKWGYPYIGILNSESSKYFLSIVIWKLEKSQKTQKLRFFFEMPGFSRWKDWTLTCTENRILLRNWTGLKTILVLVALKMFFRTCFFDNSFLALAVLKMVLWVRWWD